MSDSYKFDAFLSHNSSDTPRVQRLAERLIEAGLKVWFDEWSIDFGANIYMSIERGLMESRKTLLCLSESALISKWVDFERSIVLFRDPTNLDLRLIPLLLTDCEIPDTLEPLKRIDYRQEADAAFQMILRACRKASSPPPSIEDNLLGTWFGQLTQSGCSPLDLCFEFWDVDTRGGVKVVRGEANHPDFTSYLSEIEARVSHGKFWKIDYWQTSSSTNQPGYGTFYVEMKYSNATIHASAASLDGHFVGYGEEKQNVVFGKVLLTKIKDRRRPQ